MLEMQLIILLEVHAPETQRVVPELIIKTP